MARSRNAVFRPRTRIRLAPKSRARYNRLPRNSTLDGLDERLRILFLFNYTVLVGILYYDAAPRIERKGGLMTVFRDYFSREGGRDANTAGVIWIFYGGDDRRKIEVGLLDNKLIRSWRKLRNSKLLYQPRYIFLVSPTQSFQHRIVNLTEESFNSE